MEQCSENVATHFRYVSINISKPLMQADFNDLRFFEMLLTIKKIGITISKPINN